MEGDSLVEEELVVGGHVLKAHADVVTLVPEVIRIKLPWINSEGSLSFQHIDLVLCWQLHLSAGLMSLDILPYMTPELSEWGCINLLAFLSAG